METFLYIIFFLSCLILVVSVLLQPGKTDAGALFTSNISSAAMNPRGTQSVLSKLTIAAAAVFMLSALLLALPAIKGNVSVLETEGAEKTKTGEPKGKSDSDKSKPAGASVPAKPSGDGRSDAGKKPDTKKSASGDAKTGDGKAAGSDKGAKGKKDEKN